MSTRTARRSRSRAPRSARLPPFASAFRATRGASSSISARSWKMAGCRSTSPRSLELTDKRLAGGGQHIRPRAGEHEPRRRLAFSGNGPAAGARRQHLRLGAVFGMEQAQRRRFRRAARTDRFPDHLSLALYRGRRALSRCATWSCSIPTTRARSPSRPQRLAEHIATLPVLKFDGMLEAPNRIAIEVRRRSADHGRSKRHHRFRPVDRAAADSPRRRHRGALFPARRQRRAGRETDWGSRDLRHQATSPPTATKRRSPIRSAPCACGRRAAPGKR